MYRYQYKIGGVVIAVETPEEIQQKEPYSLFLCENEPPDMQFVFQYTQAFPSPGGLLLYDSDGLAVYAKGSERLFFYKNRSEAGFYACRTASEGDLTHQTVYFAHKNRGKLWIRILFTVLSFEDIAALHGGSIFHASYIDVHGEAVLFTAPCGTGKSTQADLWHTFREAEIINGDKVLITAGKTSAYAHGLPFSGSSKICQNRTLAIKAIVRLGQAPENEIIRLTGLPAYRSVLEGCYQSFWNPSFSQNIASLAETIVHTTPVFRLDCVPDETAVETLENELRKI